MSNVINTVINNTYIPLQFWFNHNPNLELPLIAIQYNNVVTSININTEFNNIYHYKDTFNLHDIIKVYSNDSIIYLEDYIEDYVDVI
jgi:hypothetical protein